MIEGKDRKVFSRFIFVGVLNTAVGYGLFALLIYFNVFYLLSLTIAHILGTLHSYLWNRFFTFRSANKIRQEVPKFAAVYTFIYVLNSILLYFAVNILKLNVLISQFFLLGLVTTISFLGQRYWTFRR